MRRFQRILILRGAFALAAVMGPAGAAAANEPLPCSVDALNVTCVMIGLDNPRGLAFGRHGTLFVAEAGRGGAVTAPCKAGTGFNCYGHTGAISRLWHGEQVRVATGFASLSFVLGASARGASDIVMWSGKGPQPSVLGEKGALMTIGMEADPAKRAGLGRLDLGRLVHIPASTLMAPSSALCPTCWSAVADLSTFQPVPNPDPNRESDPYGLLVERHGQRHGERHGHHDGDSLIYVDASRNWLLRMEPQGEISQLAVFPSRFQGRSTDAVPTSVVKGPDGDYYVGELVGIPNSGPTRPPSNVYRVAAEPPHAVTVFLTGFNAIIDMAFKDGDLYVLQHWTVSPQAVPRDGQLIRVPCYGRPLVCDGPRTVVIGGLDGPTSIAFGHGALYISNHGASPAFVNGVYTPVGEVLRMDLGLGDDDDHDEDEHGDEV